METIKINVPGPIKRLDKAEFAAALRKGQGRAMLHVIHYGLEDVKGLVLEACLHNQVYDQQIESSRGEWLFSMFKDSTHFAEFRTAILNAQKLEEDNRNLFQLCHLTCEFTELGDAEARRALGDCVYRMAAKPNAEDWPVVYMWVEIGGLEGMLELARIYGQRLVANPKDNVTDLSSLFEDHPEYRIILQASSSKEAGIRMYWEYLERPEGKDSSKKNVSREVRKQQIHEQIRERYTLPDILNDAQNGVGDLPVPYLTFGRHAPVEELEQVYAELMKKTKESVRTRLLWVFRRASLPHLDDVIFDWAVGANDELRAASIGALAQISDERVHRLARLKMETSSILGADHEALDLFLRNYVPDDAMLITKSLEGLRAIPEDAHELGFSLIDIAEKYEDPGLVGGILWVYENTPCGFCRYRAVDWLSKLGLLSDALRHECKYDSQDGIRELVGEEKAI